MFLPARGRVAAKTPSATCISQMSGSSISMPLAAGADHCDTSKIQAVYRSFAMQEHTKKLQSTNEWREAKQKEERKKRCAGGQLHSLHACFERFQDWEMNMRCALVYV